MSIAFSCPDCGKSFKVPDGMAGRDAKCSGCGTMMEIPNTVAITERPSRKSHGPAAGEADVWREDDLPRKKQASQRIADEEDDDDGAPVRKRRKKPRKQAKKSGALILVLLLIGFTALLGVAGVGGGLAWYFWPRSVDPQKFAPDNCNMVMVMNMEQLEGTHAFDVLERESSSMNSQMFAGQGSSFKKSRVLQMYLYGATGSGGFGNGPLPIGGNSMNSEQVVVVIKTKDSISVDDLRNDPNLKGPFTDTKVNGYTLYEGTPTSFCRLNNRQVLLGPANALRNVLNRDKKIEFSENLKTAITKADFSKPLAMAIDTSGPATLGGPNAAAGNSTETLWLAIQGVFAQNINLTIAAQSRSERGAQQIKKEAETLLGFLKLMPGQKLLAGEPKMTVSGSTFTADVTINVDAFAQTIKQAKDNPFNPPGVNPPGNNPPGGNPGRPRK